MKEDLEQFVYSWVAGLTELSVRHEFKFDTRACYIFVKYLMDGDLDACNYNPSHYDLEKIYRMYELLPESLVPVADELLTKWKLKVYTDPDKVATNTVVPIQVPKTIESEINDAYAYGEF